MPKKLIPSIAILLILICSLLSGCSTVSYNQAQTKYTSNSYYNQVSNLPKDYPTRYLPNGNLWSAYRHDMDLPLNLRNKQVQAQIRWFQNHQDFLNRSLTRGAQYFYYVYSQTKVRHLPAELALIPVFESGYVPVGHSNKGAVGLWQFMPGTAHNFGMRMNRWYDGRRDVVASTNAALKYFTYLYYYFDKDWLQAIAAYNCGEGRMQSAILSNKRRGLSTDFWSLSPPRQTQEYIPRLLALSAVIKDPSRYGINLVAINNAPYFAQVDFGRRANFAKVAKMAGANLWTMSMLNAGYLHGVTEPDGPHVILVPRSRLTALKDKLEGRPMMAANNAEQPSTATSDEGAGESAKAAALKLADADNTSRVANKVTKLAVADDTSANVQSSTSTSISKAAASEDEDNSDSDNNNSNNNDSSSSDDSDNNGTTPIVSSPTDIGATTEKTVLRKYHVKRGETLLAVARKYHVTPSHLRAVNNLHGNSLHARQVIVVPMITQVAVNNGSSKRRGHSQPVHMAAAAIPVMTHGAAGSYGNSHKLNKGSKGKNNHVVIAMASTPRIQVEESAAESSSSMEAAPTSRKPSSVSYNKMHSVQAKGIRNKYAHSKPLPSKAANGIKNKAYSVRVLPSAGTNDKAVHRKKASSKAKSHA